LEKLKQFGSSNIKCLGMLSKPNGSLESIDLDDMLAVRRKLTTDFQALKECNGTISFDMTLCLVSRDKRSTEDLNRSSFSSIVLAMVPDA